MNERRVALLGGMLASIGPLALALYTPAMPMIAEAFDANEATVKGTLSIYFAGYAGAQLLGGPLSDRFGRKPVAQAFLLIFIAGSIGTLLASTIDILIWSRLLQGIGAASGMVIARAIVRDLFTGDSSARVLNITSIVLGAGPMVAPAIGGGSIVLAGWQAPFVLMFLLGIASMVIVHFKLLETRPEGLDEAGLSMIVKDYGAILRHREFLWSALTVSGAVATFYAQSTVLSFIIMGQLGYDAAQFGLFMLFVSGGYFLGAILVRVLIPRFGAFRLVPFGLSLLVASALCMAVLLTTTSPRLSSVLVPVTTMIFANAFVLPGMYTACLSPFAKQAGAAAAMSGFMTMGLGLLASLFISLVADPSLGLAAVDVAMVSLAAGCYLLWRRSSPDGRTA
ncbi:multidrug effflux MFS transporter [Oricola sp.]|uniref:multidrug effflux MFS transporter n=1 Tax=Oricola sp. TaxID=1979950 RepID=UPI0025F9EE62|nr:multidrug effflux MFS transporter [Oricola sp.]MCI5074443.1 multidrug effflux MFS transporter [Oricola sp.]